MRRYLYLIGLLIGCCLPGMAQPSAPADPVAADTLTTSAEASLPLVGPHKVQKAKGLDDVTRYGTALFTTSFNFEDIYLGFQGSYPITPFLAAMLSFDFRPSAMRVLVEEPGGVYYQYRERRYLPALGLELRYNIVENFQLFASVRGGFLFGDYRGMATKRPEEGFVVVPNAGIAWITDIFTIRASYEYQDVKNDIIFPHRVNIGLGFMFGTER